MVFLYLNAQAADLAALASLDLNAARSRFPSPLSAVATQWQVDDWCGALGLPAPVPADQRLEPVLCRLDADPDAFPTVDALARALDLSRSRTQALFTATVGMPFRRYRLWRRMACVMVLLHRGATLTQAAMDAGFASPSHLATAFRTQFGLSPSAVVGRGIDIDWVEPPQVA
jgi:AraC-like DNA-binding protein